MLEIDSLVDGKYRILRVIGRGGMSVVYHAINERANKTWAIKEVRRDGVKDYEVVRQGLVTETNMLKKLSHPNLPSIVDVIEEEDTFLIVMDYIEGRPLSWYLAEYGAAKQEDVIVWARQLCDVLGYLHTREHPIIYRDMKPSNVMLKPDGNLMLIDFGTAREFKERNLADTVCLGTVGYAAPEQFGGRGQTDARTDIYCLGATLFHLVTGCNPSEPPYEMKPIRSINPALSAGLEKIILKCTQRDPQDRYQSCAELMYDLEHYNEIDEAHKSRQRRKLGLFTASCVLAAVSLFVGAGSQYLGVKAATDEYAQILEDAAKETDEGQKAALYREAINLQPQRAEAYLNLMEAYKEDASFSEEEEKGIVSELKNHKEEIQENKSRYADVSFELGKLYWYYYGDGNSEENRTSRMKSAVNWFSDAVSYGGKEYENYHMAEIYKEIGIFYRDIPSKAIEGDDRGMYAPLFEKFQTLTAQVEQNPDESEIVRLELCELVRSAMMQYATKFKSDGITEKAMLKLYEQINRNIQETVATTEKTEQIRQSSLDLMEDTRTAIETAYSTGKKVK